MRAIRWKGATINAETGLNPIETPDATADPAGYVRSLLEILGGRDPLQVLGDTPARVRELFSRDPDAVNRTLAEGEWSAATVLGHLVDVEIVYGFRLRLTLTEAEPEYPGYDEKRWSELPRPPGSELVETFAALRAYNLVLMRALDRSEWSRRGVHGEQGPETVETMIKKVAGHDLAHLNQIERTLAVASR